MGWMHAARGTRQSACPLCLKLASHAPAEAVKALLQAGADPNFVSGTANFALRAACLVGDSESIVSLLQAGADPNLETGRGCAMATACLQDGADITTLLCAHADIHRRSSAGQTPLQLVATHNKLHAARALLRHGADPLEAADDGLTAMDLAERQGHLDMLQLLRQYAVAACVDESLRQSEQRQKVRVPQGSRSTGELRRLTCSALRRLRWKRLRLGTSRRSRSRAARAR